MRTYFTFGACELTSAQSHMLISAHGLYDRTAYMNDTMRERKLSVMRHSPMQRGALSRTVARPGFLEDIGVHL